MNQPTAMALKRKTAGRATAAVAALALAASACTSSADTSNRADTSLSAAPAATVISEDCPIAEPAEHSSIDVMIWQIPVAAVIAGELEECASGNLTVETFLLPLDEAQSRRDAELKMDPPDYEIIPTTNEALVRYEHDLLDLTPFIDKYRDQYDLDDTPEAFWSAATVNGRILGVPLFTNTLHLFYNTEILAANDLAAPDSYDELLAACGVLRDAGYEDPFNVAVSYGTARAIHFNVILMSLGGVLINDDNTPGWNNAAGLEAADTILAVSEACMSDAGRAFSVDDAEAALRTGALPMAQTWADRAAAMDDPATSDVVGKIEFAPALRTHADTARNAPAITAYLSIPSRVTVDPELVFQVMMAGTDLESQNAAAAYVTAARLSATHPDAPRNSGVAARSITEGVGPWTYSPGLDLARNVISDAVLAIIQHGADPATELARAETAYIEQATTAGLL